MVVITNIESSKYITEGYSEFCIDSWKQYCKRWDIPLKIISEDKFVHPKFSYLSVFDEVDSEKVICVDLDTIVHPQTPNLMELFDKTLTVVRDVGIDKDKISDRMVVGINLFENYFPSFKMDKSNYFNSGMLMMHRNQSEFLKECKNWVESNYDKMIEFEKKGGVGLDQIPFNWFVQKNKLDTNFLDIRYNRTSPLKENRNIDDNFILHFRGPKPNRKIKRMYGVYKRLLKS